jgi:uncharacterized protein
MIKKIKAIQDRFITSLVTYPKRYFIICTVLMLATLPSLTQIELRFGTKIWFRTEDKHIQDLDMFEKTFGNDDSIVIALESKNGIFNKQELLDLKKITDLMAETVPDVIRVDSLWNFNHSYAVGDELITEAFLDLEKIEDQNFVLDRREKALKHRIIESYLVGKEARSAFVYGRLIAKDEALVDYPLILEKVESIIKQFSSNPNYYLYHLGGPTMNVAYKSTSLKDIATILPILLLLIMIYLFFTFKSVIAVMIPLYSVLGSVSTAVFFANITGHKFNSLTLILPSVLICICIAYSVHIINTYIISVQKHGDKIRACRESLEKNIWPVFLTNITTVVGFFTLIPSDIKPISELGIYVGTGTFFSLFFTYCSVVPALLLFNLKVKKKVDPASLPKGSLPRRYIHFLNSYKWLFLVIIISITSTLAYLGFQNEINSNPYKFFKPSHKLSISNEHVLENMGGIGGPELVIDSGKEEGVKDPAFLKQVDVLAKWIETMPEVNKVLSIIDMLKEMNQALMGGDPAQYAINDSQATIAEELFLYTVSLPQGQDLNNRVDITNRYMRMSVLWRIQDSKASMEEIEKIEAKAKELGINLIITGKAQLFQRMNSYIVETFVSSMFSSLIIISIIMTFIFRSVKMGFFSMVPNIVPIFMGAGVLDLLHKPIDMGCAIVASIALGIAVDDTIHFINHYLKERRKGRDIAECLIDVMENTGVALIITNVILVSSFGLFMFGDLVTNVNFGLLMALVLTIAMFCDIIFLPLLLLTRYKK